MKLSVKEEFGFHFLQMLQKLVMKLLTGYFQHDIIMMRDAPHCPESQRDIHLSFVVTDK